MLAHEALDPLWEVEGYGFSRGEVYRLLAEDLGVQEEQCHISWFSAEQCAEVARLCWWVRSILLGLKQGIWVPWEGGA